MRVCIVGAGFSGLAAAEALSAAGIEVHVLEARARVGGRVWSQELPNGAVIERGAEFILEDYDVMRGLARRLGVELVPTGMAYGDREPRGGPATNREELVEAATSLAGLARRRAGDPKASVGELLDALEASDGARAAIEARLSISTAYEARSLAAHLATHTSSTFSTGESARLVGGNSRLADELERRLDYPVLLSHAVRRVQWEGASVRLSGEGFDLTADAAVITVPATVVSGIAFDPVLPEGKRRVIEGVDYGHAAKLFVPLAGHADPSAVMSVPDRFWSWTAFGANGTVQPVVSCFAGSSTALDLLGVRGAGRIPVVWLDRLAEMRPELALARGHAVVSTWDDDPWALAAYTVELAGRPRDHAALAEPAGALFFAGEHSAGKWSGTMEGALQSGRRAAEQVSALRR